MREKVKQKRKENKTKKRSWLTSWSHQWNGGSTGALVGGGYNLTLFSFWLKKTNKTKQKKQERRRELGCTSRDVVCLFFSHKTQDTQSIDFYAGHGTPPPELMYTKLETTKKESSWHSQESQLFQKKFFKNCCFFFVKNTPWIQNKMAPFWKNILALLIFFSFFFRGRIKLISFLK